MFRIWRLFVLFCFVLSGIHWMPLQSKWMCVYACVRSIPFPLLFALMSLCAVVFDPSNSLARIRYPNILDVVVQMAFIFSRFSFIFFLACFASTFVNRILNAFCPPHVCRANVHTYIISECVCVCVCMCCINSTFYSLKWLWSAHHFQNGYIYIYVRYKVTKFW